MSRKLLSVVGVFFLVSCFTPRKENEIREDIYNLQTRILKVEQGQGVGAGSATQNKKQLAATSSEMEKLRLEINKLHGEIDRLRVGVQTGELPGSDPDDGSVAQTLSGIVTRLEGVEENQAEILALLENRAGSGDKVSDRAKKISSVSDIRSAFNSKRYLHVVQTVESVSKNLKKSSEQEEILYLHAESLYKLGKLRESALKFNEFIEKYASSKRLPHAKMRMGDCFRHLGDVATAKLYYQELLSRYPKTQQAEKAKERLDGFEKQGASVKPLLPVKNKFAAKPGVRRNS